MKTLLSLALLLALLPLAAAADMHKCQYQGTIAYQDVPCPEGTELPFDMNAARLTIPAPAQPENDASNQSDEPEEPRVELTNADLE
ncbi:hypothetical protein [Billgrantia bachuensis]|uniref:DUF4124 domain-containing protein n=1 Tax=Billgrantia bachuensis TaxID=2717286 RepID=A0ABX0PQ70_9GAMM|nr:hypothetical protein [Halomonas bachuensis]NIC05268.1 hypothetical protein [Halomonas bachuensis]